MKKIIKITAAALLFRSLVVTSQVLYKTIKVDGLNIAYREAGSPSNPKLVLLHDFPAGSHQLPLFHNSLLPYKFVCHLHPIVAFL